MSIYSYQETLWRLLADGAVLANSAAATTLIGVAANQTKVTIPAGTLDAPGRILRLTACGRISTLTAAPGTLTLDLRLGGVIIANGGAMALNATAKVNVPWTLMWELTLRAVGGGVTANFMHQGTFTSEANIGAPLPAAGGATSAMLPNAAPVVGTGFDSTANQTFDVFGTWSIANAANSITMHQARLELLF